MASSIEYEWLRYFLATSHLICALGRQFITHDAPATGQVLSLLSYKALGDIAPDLTLPIRAQIDPAPPGLLYNGASLPCPYHSTLVSYYNHPKWGVQDLALRCYLIDLTATKSSCSVATALLWSSC